MPHPLRLQPPSFVTSSLLISSTPLQRHRRALSVCTRTQQRYTPTRWRCKVNDAVGSNTDNDPMLKESDNVDQAPVPLDAVQEDVSDDTDEQKNDSEEGVDPIQVEGMLSDALGQNFEDVLSKDWDLLVDFDHENPDDVKAKEETKDKTEEKDDAEVTEDAAIDEPAKEEMKTSTADEAPSEKAKKTTRKTRAKKKDVEAVVVDENEEEEPLLKPKKRGRKPTKPKKPAKAKVTDMAEEVVELTEEEASLSRMPRWYFVQVKPGCENSCAVSIGNLAKSVEGDDIIDVLVPMTTTLRLTKSGNSMHKEERFFPGYIIVLMIMNRLSYGHIQRVMHVQYFMGDPNREKKKDQPFRPPLPVSDAEMKKVFMRINKDPEEVERAEEGMGFKLDEAIRVIAGSMEGSKGRVVEVKPDLELVRCKLDVFGLETTVDMQTNQLERYDEEEEAAKEKERLERIAEAEQRKWKNRGRDRVKATFGDVDYKNAKVASSADDLAMLLSDDLNDDWDPMMDVFPKRGTKGGGGQRDGRRQRDGGQRDGGQRDSGNERDMFEDGFVGAETEDFDGREAGVSDGSDGFTAGEVWETSDTKDKDLGLISSDDDLDGFLKSGDEEEFWGAKDSKDRTTENDRSGTEATKSEDTFTEEEFVQKQADLFSSNDNESADGTIDAEWEKAMDEVDKEFREGLENMKDKHNGGGNNDDEREDVVDDRFFADFADMGDEFEDQDDFENRIDDKPSMADVKKVTHEEESELDEVYGMDVDLNSGDLSDIGEESIIKVEGEEQFAEIELTDPGPYPQYDYDEAVAKEKEMKKKGSQADVSGTQKIGDSKKRRRRRNLKPTASKRNAGRS